MTSLEQGIAAGAGTWLRRGLLALAALVLVVLVQALLAPRRRVPTTRRLVPASSPAS